MQSQAARLSVYVALFFLLLIVAVLVPFRGSAQTPAASVVKKTSGLMPTDRNNPADQPKRNLPGTFRWNIFENERVIVDARTYAPGERTDISGKYHTEAFDVLTIMLTPGTVEMIATGEEMETGYFEAGHTWWWTKSPPGGHSIANVGTTPFTYLNIRLKESPHP